MDIQQLKLLAGRVRGLLEQSNITVSHNQALDLSGALVGLRNWPEVQAFPSRVTAAELDGAATSRLSYRLQKRHGLALPADELLRALRPPAASGNQVQAPQIWPSGPVPGVYVTTEQKNIDTLMASYDDATDGALIYAERAGNHWDSSIDLGQDGLWSSGLHRVPSGTLLVLGPIELNQQAWADASARLEMACLKAQTTGLRVAVLVHTDTPDTLFHDVDLMVRGAEPAGDDTHEALLGVVDDHGELVVRTPFVSPLPAPSFLPSRASHNALPAKSVTLLNEALRHRKAGLLLLGSSEIKEHWAIDLVDAVLPMTDFAGPAARIKPRKRSTPSKDWDIPDALKALPYLPSIESAYSQGYRRMVVNAAYSDADTLLKYGSEVLFISGGHGGGVDDLFIGGLRFGRIERVAEGLKLIIAILAVTQLKTDGVEEGLPDLYIPNGREFRPSEDYDAVLESLRESRVLRAEQSLAELLDAKRVTPKELRKVKIRARWVSEFLDEYAKSSSMTR